ncbi:hypothetical protein JCM21900_004164 [Sporobolomyces salmonicolor]
MTSKLLYATAPYIVFSDFDGTITTQDSNDTATDELGFGLKRRRELNIEILNGTKNFRDGFKEMLDSVCANGHSFDSVVEYLRKKIKLDPGFKPFFEYCKARDIPVVIVSSGMIPIIRAILTNLVGEEDAARIQIVANDVQHLEDGKWTIKYLHPETGYGHDKSRATAPYRDLPHNPTLFFCGDGVSDLSAARAADLLFVKVVENHPNDLAVHCNREKIPYVPFAQFEQVRDVVSSVVQGEKTIEEHLAATK